MMDISNITSIQVTFLVVLAFICEYIDSSLGAGYGTTLTPLLMLLGFEPATIVPAVLFSEFLSGMISGGLHILVKNVQVGNNKSAFPVDSPGNMQRVEITATAALDMEKGSMVKNHLELTIDSKIIIIFSLFGVGGSIIAACISSFFSYHAVVKFGIKLYIAVMVFTMGIITLCSARMDAKFSFKKITSIGALAGFNKSISGGGYGPLAVTGQIIIGRDGKNAIGTTSLSEGIICLSGVITYFITSTFFGIPFLDFKFTSSLIIGALLSTPLAVFTTKKVKSGSLKKLVGVSTLILGMVSLFKLFIQ